MFCSLFYQVTEQEQMHLSMPQQELCGDITVAEETLDSANIYLKYRERLLQGDCLIIYSN
jgi:hypothetical protein